MLTTESELRKILLTKNDMKLKLSRIIAWHPQESGRQKSGFIVESLPRKKYSKFIGIILVFLFLNYSHPPELYSESELNPPAFFSYKSCHGLKEMKGIMNSDE